MSVGPASTFSASATPSSTWSPPAEDDFLSKHDMRKGAMALIDGASGRGAVCRDAARPGEQRRLGGQHLRGGRRRSAPGSPILGKVADDALGAVFAPRHRAAGVHFPTPPLTGGAPTARCLILVTPDGAADHEHLSSAPASRFERSRRGRARWSPTAAVTYLEGYLFDPPAGPGRVPAGGRAGARAGRQVALSLSDPFCVDRHRAAFRELVRGHVDILFANEAEMCSLYEENDFEDAAEARARATWRSRR